MDLFTQCEVQLTHRTVYEREQGVATLKLALQQDPSHWHVIAECVIVLLSADHTWEVSASTAFIVR